MDSTTPQLFVQQEIESCIKTNKEISNDILLYFSAGHNERRVITHPLQRLHFMYGDSFEMVLDYCDGNHFVALLAMFATATVWLDESKMLDQMLSAAAQICPEELYMFLSIKPIYKYIANMFKPCCLAFYNFLATPDNCESLRLLCKDIEQEKILNYPKALSVFCREEKKRNNIMTWRHTDTAFAFI